MLVLVLVLRLMLTLPLIAHARSRGRGRRPRHVAEFFAVLGGGLKDAGWQNPQLSKSRLAIVPGYSHCNFGESLHDWLVNTPTFRGTHPGRVPPSGDAGADINEEFAARSMSGFGAWIMGRNMFGPIRGPWPDESWRGWWGENPQYHAPSFVLTHDERAPMEMEGGTVFHFVTDGIEAAQERARAAAGDKYIRLLGGADSIRQYLKARLVDELHVAVTPILLGSGEPMFAGIDHVALGYKCTNSVASEKATHYTITRV